MEIITGVERRRRWRLEEKRRIVAEAEAPGAVFAAVARRHDVSRGQLWNWRRLARAGLLGAVRGPEFLPVQVMPKIPLVIPGMDDGVSARGAASQAACPDAEHRTMAQGRIEIRLANGTSVRIEGRVEPALVRAAIAAARG